MSKIWKDLRFIKQIVIKPEDPKNPMWVDFKEDHEYEDSYEVGCLVRPMLVHSERSIRLGANTMYEIQTDYPEDFKKLLAATGDSNEAYRLYKALQNTAPANWADYSDEGNVWH